MRVGAGVDMAPTVLRGPGRWTRWRPYSGCPLSASHRLRIGDPSIACIVFSSRSSAPRPPPPRGSRLLGKGCSIHAPSPNRGRPEPRERTGGRRLHAGPPSSAVGGGCVSRIFRLLLQQQQPVIDLGLAPGSGDTGMSIGASTGMSSRGSIGSESHAGQHWPNQQTANISTHRTAPWFMVMFCSSGTRVRSCSGS